MVNNSPQKQVQTILLKLIQLCSQGVDIKKFVKIGRPGYRVTKQRDADNGQQSLLFEVVHRDLIWTFLEFNYGSLTDICPKQRCIFLNPEEIYTHDWEMLTHSVLPVQPIPWPYGLPDQIQRHATQVDYPEIAEGIFPRHRFMSAYEQKVIPPHHS